MAGDAWVDKSFVFVRLTFDHSVAGQHAAPVILLQHICYLVATVSLSADFEISHAVFGYKIDSITQ